VDVGAVLQPLLAYVVDPDAESLGVEAEGALPGRAGRTITGTWRKGLIWR
jgi:hypothetical protein